MSDTPRTDANLGLFSRHCGFYIDQNGEHVAAGFARQLERELAAMQAQRDRLAEALEHIATHGGRHQAPLRDSIDNIARNALAAVEGGQP